VPPRLGGVLRDGIQEPGWLRRIRSSGDGAAFIGSDPSDRRLGSGGATVNLLFEAWQAECASGSAIPLEEWLATSQKLIIHSGGETRRLPAYAAVGKAFMPLPPVEGLSPRLHDQVLADFQIPTYLEVLAEGTVWAGGITPAHWTSTIFPGPKINFVFNAATIFWCQDLSMPPTRVFPSCMDQV